MWKDIFDVGKQIFGLARELAENKKDIRELRELLGKRDEELKEIRQEQRQVAELM